ncbi:Type I restriction enzyme EcoprrI M protein [Desulfonema limicola]|uniref:site-specific DNA-methyltransferase (adenine-specific) n=1 Tax=Desulfonema limicola TaxID=45656 RepID=A0A975GIT9_9BACT|nr:type I restriction-modification system subunit M [Desulfonema limicola]QTA82709.1 Type I restriction enzyme EcoprrI M protein [Desulfonema limicola]
MAIKKSELYSSLWASCDELRGGMDASQYKDYVLVLLFVKYVSDKYAGNPDALIEIPDGGSFQDMSALKHQKGIGDSINKIIGRLAESNDLKGVIDVADFNDEDRLGKGKEMVDRLSNLIAIFETPALNFSKNRADGDDILGDAYEYLMKHFATQSGKSKGQFYTPSEVSRIIAKVIGIKNVSSSGKSIYDPTCGSGSLLLKAVDETEYKVTIYGQEKDVATSALARMNMILHGNETAEITRGQSTISDPLFKDKHGNLKTFDFVVANPPFSSKNWMNGFDPGNDLYERFKGFGVPPAKNGDYAFLLHIVKSLKSKGKGACILPHGVLFRGNVEASIRKNLIKKGYIKGVIGLPPNLFYGTGIPACIIVVDKENAEDRKGVFMIDAGKGFLKDGNKNRLREQDIHKVVDVFNKQITLPKFSRMVALSEISDPKNDYNLNIPRYIDSQEEEDLQDIEAHLTGGIPNADIDALEKYWDVYPGLKAELFEPSKRDNYSSLKVESDLIKSTIFEYPEFVTFSKDMDSLFKTWKTRNTKMLKALKKAFKPKELIFRISEDLLTTYTDKKLIDKYDVYQHLMDFWNETMQDDCYLITMDEWKAEVYRILVENKAGKKVDKGWNCDLVPKNLVVDRFFLFEKQAIEKLEADKESIGAQIEELAEEHSGEDGLLEEVKNDKGKITKALLLDRQKEIKSDKSAKEELKVIKAYLKLIAQEAETAREIRTATAELDIKVIERYKTLTVDEIKSLVVDDKWMADIEQRVKTEMERISQRLTQRIKELAERYEIPLPQQNLIVDDLENKVNAHLQKMGFVWN